MANASDSRYWSDVAHIEQRTLPVVPPTPPTTHPGSFEIIGGINDRTVVVFWKKLDEKFHNGDNFRYTVTNTWVGNHPIPLEPHVTTSAYMEFRKVSLEQFSVSITSENSVGQVSYKTFIFRFHKDIPIKSWLLSTNIIDGNSCDMSLLDV